MLSLINFFRDGLFFKSCDYNNVNSRHFKRINIMYVITNDQVY